MGVAAGWLPAQDVGSEAFMAMVRNPQSDSYWAILTGDIRYKPDGGKFSATPVSVRLRMTAAELRAQILFNEAERYLVVQAFGDDATPAVVTAEQPPVDGQLTLADVGIRPADLAMSFLHWQLLRELPGERVRTVPCRVVDLAQPGGSEIARAWIAEDFLAPLAVEWRRADDAEPHRKLAFKGSQKVNGVMLTKQVDLNNESGKTSVRFENLQAGFIRSDKPEPNDLFAKN